jgi:hypothetical protein
MTSQPSTPVTRRVRNAECDWDSFDPADYFAHNYQRLRDDDHRIIEIIREYFAGTGIRQARGVDVGTGANLYPALAMLPFCASLDLLDRSRSNIEWLEEQISADGRADFAAKWRHAWSALRANPVYAALPDPHARLAAIADPHKRSVFELGAGEWDLGTMFFVACSISADEEEFREAVRHFVRALVPGGPFAMAVMANSDGYAVGGTWFPGVVLDVDMVAASLDGIADALRIEEIGSAHPLRDGVAMIVATGRASRRPMSPARS